ncbi:MAG: bifunctional 5,10-methylenetetrahydrofolate dehydrogenase/5,10-methenyltetrahydrofolate cyclohydrolase [candidate division WOR-3 bacterium]|nr:bifunctional 5,10-methylenetetrahydrofolate dehydrogenase/5,10-methenyltetrahydrofolate cyclohydrolase [candidate division WOR-3 bacterium]MCX7948056.1 bifunctional 5,10-methylenetetrahydrofolate dehydrogenase/5,10-methenyltetrahydrofolate cyclohydrolase [candidate division WOR-3 bacterium]MDW8151006.1 bifunctional 5,10-methylenetetrahydrofolate dehydrogenase/5,10-methenyltetrahydrofolate cyclohydrolase [candidate division WOR-3 bacterium]
MKLLNGKPVAELIYSRINQIPVKIAVVILTKEQSTILYIQSKIKKFSQFNINYEIIDLNENISEEEFLKVIDELNLRLDINGIFIEMPLPNHIDQFKVFSRISPRKDIEGLNPYNLGRILYNKECIVPSTARAVVELLDYYNIEVEGKNVVVVGRSITVGKPLSLLLLNKNATITICHSKTKDLKDMTKNADILICAIGKPNYIKAEHLKKGAIVIDIGINCIDNKVVGDVDFEDVKNIVSAITPVPGGIGPITTAITIENCFKLVEKSL